MKPSLNKISYWKTLWKAVATEQAMLAKPGCFRSAMSGSHGSELGTADPAYAEPEGDHFYYFGYGSNLLTQRLRLVNPSAEFVATGELEDYALDFGGHGSVWNGAVATIAPHPGSTVHGAIYKLSIDHSKTLDAQESGYRRVLVSVRLHNNSTVAVTCRCYVMKEETYRERNKPSPHYKHVIVSGAKEVKLPMDYIRILEAIEHNGFAGRIAYDLDVLKELNTAVK